MEQNDEILEDKEKKVKTKKRFLITYSIWFFVIFIIFVLTLVFFNRLLVFGKIFYNYGGFFQITGLILYIIALFALLLYYGYTFTIIMMKRQKHEDWYPKVSKLFARLDLTSFICKCITILLFIFIFMFNPCTVEGDSMEDTVHASDRIVTSSFTKLDKDDIIVFDASNYSHAEAFYIKRIVAMENDKISYIDGELYVNDVKESRGNVTKTEYRNLMNSALSIKGSEETSEIISVTIPKNKILVLGDNRRNSYDSRMFGLIDESDVYGEVIIRLFPFSEFKFF